MILLLGGDVDVARGIALGVESRGRAVAHAAEVDVTSMRAVRAAVVERRPVAVVLLSSLDDPDVAEADPDRAFTVNAEGPIHLGAACLETRARAILLSTAEVYGQRGGPFSESDDPAPVSAFARTKRQGETFLMRADPKAIVLRTGPILGPTAATEHARLTSRGALGGLEGPLFPIEEASDELVQPIVASQVGEVIDALIAAGVSGLYHAATPDAPISRVDLLTAAAERLGLAPAIVVGRPGRTLARAAVRSPKPVLFGDKLGKVLKGELGSWRAAWMTPPPESPARHAQHMEEEPRVMGHRQDVRRVDKPWGHEVIWAHTDQYVGKVLFVKSGERLSLQYHEKKDETVYVLSGRMVFEVGPKDAAREDLVLKAGDAYHITPFTTHRMIALEDTTILEASTPELDDVVRLEDKYGRVGTKAP